MRSGLLKKERLQKSADYKRVYSLGRSFKAREDVAWVCPNSLNYNRLGISTPKRKFRLSSERNKIKRLIRETYRTNKSKLKKGFDIVIMPGRAKEKRGYIELEKDMLKVYKKAGILE